MSLEKKKKKKEDLAIVDDIPTRQCSTGPEEQDESCASQFLQNIILSPRLSSLHFLLPARSTGILHMCLCFPFSSRSSEDATEEVAFEQNLEIWIQLLCSFTTQRKISTNFTLIFLYHPRVPYLSAGQGNVSTICILESRQLEFPFSLCYLPDE